MIGDGVYCCAASVVLVPARRRLAASALVQHAATAAAAPFSAAMAAMTQAQVQKRSASSHRALACLLALLGSFCMLVSNTASSAFCVGLSFVSSYLFPEGITTI